MYVCFVLIEERVEVCWRGIFGIASGFPSQARVEGTCEAEAMLDFIEKCWVTPPKRGGNVLQQRKMDAPGTVGVVESLYVRLQLFVPDVLLGLQI